MNGRLVRNYLLISEMESGISKNKLLLGKADNDKALKRYTCDRVKVRSGIRRVCEKIGADQH